MIYLCSHEDDEYDQSKIMTKTKSTNKEKSSIHAVNQQRDHQSSSVTFQNSTDELMKNVRFMISHNGLDDILLQLYEYICVIHGYVCSTIDRLKQELNDDEYFQRINASETALYSDCLNNINDLCQSTRTLLDLNKNKFRHIQMFSTIKDSFSQFDHNLKILRNQWLKNIQIKNNQCKSASTVSAITRSKVPSTPEDHHRSHKKKPKRQSKTSSSSHQIVPSFKAFKPLSLFRTSTHDGMNEKLILFQLILHCLENFFNLLKPERSSSSSCYILVKSVIAEMKSLQSTINLFDNQSLCNAKGIILSMKDRLNKTFSEQYGNSSKNELDQQMNQAFYKISKAIELVSTSLQHYQLQTEQINRSEKSNWSSPPPSFIEQRSNKRKSRDLSDDDRSSVGTCSTVEDEILFNNARNALKRSSYRSN